MRELWYARDDIARERDTSIGRVLPDAALVEIARTAPRTTADLPGGHRAIARYGRQWVEAVRRAAGDPRGRPAAPDAALRRPSAAPGLGRQEPGGRATAWGRRGPPSPQFAEERVIPVENVCSPDPLRRVVWQPPSDHDLAAFTRALLDQGARPWQAEIVGPMLVAAFEQFPDA